MMKFRVVAILLVVFLFVGCAPNIKVTKNNVPVPDRMYVSQDIQSGIKIEAFFAEMVERGDSLYPKKYLKFQKNINSNEISGSSKYICGKVRVTNPRNKPYHVVVVYNIHRPARDLKYSVANVIYSGNSFEKVVDVDREVNDVDENMQCIILIKSGYSQNNLFTFRGKDIILDIEFGYNIKSTGGEIMR